MELYKASGSYIDNNLSVYKNGAFFFFGGYNAASVIAMLDVSTKTWNQVGTLNQGRNGHAVVVRRTEFIVLGGYGTKDTERCVYDDGKMNCEVVQPILTDFSYYPETMLVNENFCLND